MRIGIVCNDTRGGVQPYIGLAEALMEKGVSVVLVAPSHLLHFASDRGFQVAALTLDADAFNQVRAKVGNAGAMKGHAVIMKEMGTALSLWMKECVEACSGCDAILAGIGGMGLGISVAEKLSVPFFHCQLQPIFASSSLFPPVLFPVLPSNAPGLLMKAGHHLSDQLVQVLVRTGLDSARKSVLGLTTPFRVTFNSPMLYGFTSRMAPVENTDKVRRIATGYWFSSPPEWTPDVELARFVDNNAGNMICIGFGSMPAGRAYDLDSSVKDAIQSSGLKAIILGGGGALQESTRSENVFFASELPHEWLFPKMRAVIHHGGAGTTGAVLRAGVPSVIIPFGMDQPFWAKRIETLKLGVALQKNRFGAETLKRAIESVLTDTAMVGNARDMGLHIQEEDGAKRAADEIFRAVEKSSGYLSSRT